MSASGVLRVGYKKRKKESVLQAAKGWFAMPKASFYHQPVLHLDCSGFAEIENCKKVLQYTEKEIQLDMGKQTLCIYGDGLVLTELAGKNLWLKGNIFQIEFRSIALQDKRS